MFRTVLTLSSSLFFALCGEHQDVIASMGPNTSSILKREGGIEGGKEKGR